MNSFASDIVIIGGGIAGLWTLHSLRQAGISALLLENNALGAGQTLASQGILHGGMKYALDGKVDAIALRLRDMPQRWLDSMAGTGEVDMRSVKVLSPCQYMWSDGSILSKISGAVGSKLLQGDVETLTDEEKPPVFGKIGYTGHVRMLKETIIDTKGAVESLTGPNRPHLYQSGRTEWYFGDGGIEKLIMESADGEKFSLQARQWIITAGIGNEIAASDLPFPQPCTQRRPLRQVMVKNVPGNLYGHCIIADPKPRFTVTTHFLADGTAVWYLGGNIAEKSAHLSEEESIRFARKELEAVFPRHDWQKSQFATWYGDRAEPHQSSRFIPAEPTVQEFGNCLLAWPTKLVFAPGLASKILTLVQEKLRDNPAAPTPALPLPQAPVGSYPWETANWTSV
jgi:hypothetical protein